MARRRRSVASGLTSIVGGIIVGFDEQVLRSLPRAEVLVQRGQTVRGLSAQGGTLLVGLPDDPVLLAGDPPGDAAEESPASSR